MLRSQKYVKPPKIEKLKQYYHDSDNCSTPRSVKADLTDKNSEAFSSDSDEVNEKSSAIITKKLDRTS